MSVVKTLLKTCASTQKGLEVIRMIESSKDEDVEKLLIFIQSLLDDNWIVNMEFNNENQIPSLLYLETPGLIESDIEKSYNLLYILSNHVTDAVSVIVILASDNESIKVLSVSLVASCKEEAFSNIYRNSIEIFVESNKVLCKNIDGIVLDKNVCLTEFVVSLFPNSRVVWSKLSFVKDYQKWYTEHDVENEMLYKNCINSKTKCSYDSNVKILQNKCSEKVFENFLKSWDACKELWVEFCILSHECFCNFPNSNIEQFLTSFTPTNTGSYCDIVQSLIFIITPYNINKENQDKFDKDIKQYRHLCKPDVFNKIIQEIAVARKSKYEIETSEEKVIIGRRDSEENFFLDKDGLTCSCINLTQSEIPCEHIFAYRIFSKKSLYSELLIPLKHRFSYFCFSFDSLSERIQSTEELNFEKQRRIKDIEAILQNILKECLFHSFSRQYKDIAKLNSLLRDFQSIQSNIGTCKVKDNTKRGRPRKKFLDLSEKLTHIKHQHNLRRNIKHKFIHRNQPEIKDEEKREIEDETVLTKEDEVCIPRLKESEPTPLKRQYPFSDNEVYGILTSDDYSEEESQLHENRVESEENISKLCSQLDGYTRSLDSKNLCSLLQLVNTSSYHARDDVDFSVPTSVVASSTTEHPQVIQSIMEVVKHRTTQSFPEYCFHVIACLISTAFHTGESIELVSKSLNPWPEYLPQEFQEKLDLTSAYPLTVPADKLSNEDVDALNLHRDLNSKVAHAYLHVLAQRHSGRVFIMPNDLVHHWKNESSMEMMFEKVPFKTFDYIVLPILCGVEMKENEKMTGEELRPYWMALVADLKKKTVAMLNPKREDLYSIAANGYIFHWRKYMQMRSIHTGEMLCSWKQINIHTSRQIRDSSSGVLMLMNVEAILHKESPLTVTEAHVDKYRVYMYKVLRETDRETTILCLDSQQSIPYSVR